MNAAHPLSPGGEASPHRPRYTLLDGLRGLTLISMILYHAAWDLVYLFGVDWAWYRGSGAFVWQQTICWTFIFLSGFCLPLGRRTVRRGLEVFAGGILVSAVTLVAMPQAPIRFGVLTLIGSCMLLIGAARRLLERLPAPAGLVLSLGLFILCRNVPSGSLGFRSWVLLPLPEDWYRSSGLGAFLGFPAPDFFSTDYFPLIPWLFLFLAGFYAFHLFRKHQLLPRLSVPHIPKFLLFLGRNSLWVYLLHQPLLYGILSLWNWLR
jgi:uncharacterized membrane protein